ncbi:MAG: UvrB/UvrC motif-containing protein [Candidatus Omnitrophica bacterium]|nr:UvrB/UvrC motif-containing protein [Candidatus Omnitrophota bacterium]MCM8798176.1 UvrB/UvrC motif-containing protein [Candidatus Omnitrophota bacterium]
MLCDICGKKQATVHVTEIINNQITEMHLCEDCAREKSIQMEQQFGVSDLLAGIADLGTTLGEKTKEELKLKCNNCGMTYEDFKKIGRLGCSECYVAFRKNLVPLLKRIHGSIQHLGKAPLKIIKEVKRKSEIDILKEKLQEAIQREEFEEAARLRDKIRELEKKNQKRKEEK